MRIPNGIRTRVAAVKGRCPRPLDDGDRCVSVDRYAVGDRISIGEGCGAVCVARQTTWVIAMGREEFEGLVAEALDTLPPAIASMMNNVVVVVEDEAPADDPDLLGVYSGVPLTERDGMYAGALPDHITIFRNPTLDMCDSREEVVKEVRITVVHEIAHHFGIDDATLHDLGYE